MEYGLLDGGEDGEHNGLGFCVISRTFAMQDAIFFGTKLFDRELDRV